MNIIITAFERSLDGGKGLARDTRASAGRLKKWASHTRSALFRFAR
jgi:hypothetical protein